MLDLSRRGKDVRSLVQPRGLDQRLGQFGIMALVVMTSQVSGLILAC